MFRIRIRIVLPDGILRLSFQEIKSGKRKKSGESFNFLSGKKFKFQLNGRIPNRNRIRFLYEPADPDPYQYDTDPKHFFQVCQS